MLITSYTEAKKGFKNAHRRPRLDKKGIRLIGPEACDYHWRRKVSYGDKIKLCDNGSIEVSHKGHTWFTYRPDDTVLVTPDPSRQRFYFSHSYTPLTWRGGYCMMFDLRRGQWMLWGMNDRLSYLIPKAGIVIDMKAQRVVEKTATDMWEWTEIDHKKAHAARERYNFGDFMAWVRAVKALEGGIETSNRWTTSDRQRTLNLLEKGDFVEAAKGMQGHYSYYAKNPPLINPQYLRALCHLMYERHGALKKISKQALTRDEYYRADRRLQVEGR